MQRSRPARRIYGPSPSSGSAVACRPLSEAALLQAAGPRATHRAPSRPSGTYCCQRSGEYQGCFDLLLFIAPSLPQPPLRLPAVSAQQVLAFSAFRCGSTVLITFVLSVPCIRRRPAVAIAGTTEQRSQSASAGCSAPAHSATTARVNTHRLSSVRRPRIRVASTNFRVALIVAVS